MSDNADSSMIQDVTKSVDQLCAQLSISNIVVPRLDAYQDIFDFINEFELVTATLPDEHRIKVLVKAFPPGRLNAWFESELKPLILKPSSWKTIKTRIINRYADTEDRDRHFQRLKDMKFDPHGQRKLFDYVEELSFSFTKAFPNESDETKVRYIKANLPQELKCSLAGISECNQSKDLDEFMKGIRRFDAMRTVTQDTQSAKVQGTELVSVFKDLLKEIREERQTTKNIVAAFQAKSREPSPHRSRHNESNNYQSSGQREPQPQADRMHRNRERSMSPRNRDLRPVSPNIRQQVVDRNSNYHPNNQNNNLQASYSNAYQNNRNISPANMPQNNLNQRGQSPTPHYQLNNQQYMDRYQFKPNQYQRENNSSHARSNNNASLFNENQYYEKFGYPPQPCSGCGHMHWYRHCLIHLNY